MTRMNIILAGAILLIAGAAGSLAPRKPIRPRPPRSLDGGPARSRPSIEAPPAAEPSAEARPQRSRRWRPRPPLSRPVTGSFALAATDKAPGASATVMVDEAEGGSDFVLVASGLPLVDSFDEENRDVNAYTVWIVPSKDKVAESELAGVLTVSPKAGRLQPRPTSRPSASSSRQRPTGAREDRRSSGPDRYPGPGGCCGGVGRGSGGRGR